MKSRAQTPRLSVAARRQIILVDVRPAYGSIITFSLADSRNAIVQSIRAVCTLTRTLIFILLLFWITASKQVLILRAFKNKIVCKIVEFSLNLDLILMRLPDHSSAVNRCTIKFCTCWWKSATNTSQPTRPRHPHEEPDETVIPGNILRITIGIQWQITTTGQRTTMSFRQKHLQELLPSFSISQSACYSPLRH